MAAKKKLKKPTTIEYFDYFQCAKYIEQKHKINTSDFFNFLCSYWDITNGSTFTIDECHCAPSEGLECHECFNYFINEFGRGKPGKRSVDIIFNW